MTKKTRCLTTGILIAGMLLVSGLFLPRNSLAVDWSGALAGAYGFVDSNHSIVCYFYGHAGQEIYVISSSDSDNISLFCTISTIDAPGNLFATGVDSFHTVLPYNTLYFVVGAKYSGSSGKALIGVVTPELLSEF